MASARDRGAAPMIRGFKAFLLRVNAVDLAIAVVLGAAFGGVVSAFADDVVGGLIGVVGGTPDFGRAGVTVNGSRIVYGSTITALITSSSPGSSTSPSSCP